MRAKKPKKKSQTYWRNKADKEVSRYHTGLPCAVCGTTRLTCGHHIVERSLSAFYRHHPYNLIALCPDHHTWSNDLAAHSRHPKAVKAFVDWLKEHHPRRYDLLDTYKQHRGEKVDYEENYNEWKAMNDEKV
jgi:DNA-binding transcriptional LysR family regulator